MATPISPTPVPRRGGRVRGLPQASGLPLAAGRWPLLTASLGLLGAGLLASAPPVEAGVLDRVKEKPALAQGLCERFRRWNAANRSANAPESIAEVAASEGISTVDAEVLTAYVIEFHCKDVR
jgi:hypothetical protein